MPKSTGVPQFPRGYRRRATRHTDFCTQRHGSCCPRQRLALRQRNAEVVGALSVPLPPSIEGNVMSARITSVAILVGMCVIAIALGVASPVRQAIAQRTDQTAQD